MSGFVELMEKSHLEEQDKLTFKYAHEFLNGKCPAHFASRSIMFSGNTGIGKTYLAEKLMQSSDGWAVIVGGASRLKGSNIRRCETMKDVVLALKSTDKAAVLIDDIDYIMEKDEMDYKFEDKKWLMELLEEVKARPDAFLLVTANSSSLDDALFDRFESKIDAELPSDSEKRQYLLNNYSGYTDSVLLEQLAGLSFGYNFRDLAEVARMAYRSGSGEVSSSSLNHAMSYYKPSGLRGYDVKRNVKLNFSGLVGREKIKAELRKSIVLAGNSEKAAELGIKRHNMLLFSGPNGTGKTAMAEALAGELGYPLIKVNAEMVFDAMGPYYCIKRVFKLAERFRNSVILFDEADKIVGRDRLGDDTSLIGALNSQAEKFEPVQRAFIVLTANNEDRLGAGVADRFAQINFDYPDLAERAEFFRKKAEGNKVLTEDFEINNLAKATDKKSFRDMEKLWESIVCKHFKTDKPVSSEDFLQLRSEFVKEQEAEAMYG